MNTDLSIFDAKIEKIRKYEQWKTVLAEMLADTEGREILEKLFVSSNGNGSASSVNVASTTALSPSRRRKKSSKRAMLEAAVLKAASTFGRPFGLRDLIDLLEKENFHFRDPLVETGSALRRLISNRDICVVREKNGRIGRLYERVLLP